MRKWEDLVDTYLHKGLRKKLVEILKEKGITDIKVLEAVSYTHLTLPTNREV